MKLDPGPFAPLTAAQRERYSRQIQLPQIGVIGQQRLIAARVLIIGMGGLGAPVAIYLAAAGVGHLVINDYDQVDLSNLQRQIIHRTGDIGRLKTDSARDQLLALNPEVEVSTLAHSLGEPELLEQINAADLVIDCSDNFDTRFTLNRLCVSAHTPLVSGAAMRMEGQVTVFLNDGDGPCYQCLYHDDGEQGDTCSQIGVLAPLVGAIGSLQAIEAIKVLTGIGEPLSNQLLVFDALEMEWRKLGLRRDPDCPICSKTQTMNNPTAPVTLPRPLVNQLLTEAQQHPGVEVCGLVGKGPNSTRCYPIANRADNPASEFLLDAEQQIDAMRQMRERGEELYAIYHSHPDGPALPSATDQRLAAYPGVLYLIISLGTTGVLEMRGFQLSSERIDEVALEV